MLLLMCVEERFEFAIVGDAFVGLWFPGVVDLLEFSSEFVLGDFLTFAWCSDGDDECSVGCIFHVVTLFGGCLLEHPKLEFFGKPLLFRRHISSGGVTSERSGRHGFSYALLWVIRRWVGWVVHALLLFREREVLSGRSRCLVLPHEDASALVPVDAFPFRLAECREGVEDDAVVWRSVRSNAWVVPEELDFARAGLSGGGSHLLVKPFECLGESGSLAELAWLLGSRVELLGWDLLASRCVELFAERSRLLDGFLNPALCGLLPLFCVSHQESSS